MKKATHHTPPQALRHQRGFGLVELAISLTLIASLLMGAFYLVRTLRDDIVRKEFTESASKVMSSASKYMASYRDTSDITTDIFLRMGGWPSTKLITHPADRNGSAAKSSIPGAWEDVSYNMVVLTNGGITYAAANEGIYYRISAVPKERCTDVIAELARYPSVGSVWGRLYTAATSSPTYLQGFTHLANGTNINTSKVNNVWLSKAGIKTVCGYEQSEILAAIVRD
jgi:hypothetical protein